MTEKLMEFLPFLIPLVVAQFALLGYTLYHILTHEHYKRGNRAAWLVITILLMPFSKWIIRLAEVLVKDKPADQKKNEQKVMLLDERLLRSPSVAIQECDNYTSTTKQTPFINSPSSSVNASYLAMATAPWTKWSKRRVAASRTS